MTEHLIVQAFAPAITDALLTKWMPPGQLDPNVGEFSNDMNLTNEEQQQLITYIIYIYITYIYIYIIYIIYIILYI